MTADLKLLLALFSIHHEKTSVGGVTCFCT